MSGNGSDVNAKSIGSEIAAAIAAATANAVPQLPTGTLPAPNVPGGRPAYRPKVVSKVGYWRECIDPESGRSYFWNKLTGVVTWECPPELGTGPPGANISEPCT